MEERDPLLSEAYRAADHPEPPPALDAGILDAARRAVARPARRRAAWFNWAVPLSTTAVLVLGIALLFQVQREAPDTLRDALTGPASPHRAGPAPAMEPRAESPAKPVPVDRVPRGADSAAGGSTTAPTMGSAPSRPAPTPALSSPEADRRQQAADAALAESRSGSSEAAAPEPRPFPAQPAPALEVQAGSQAVSAPPLPGRAAEGGTRVAPAAAPASESSRPAGSVFSKAPAGVKSEGMEKATPEQWVERIRQLMAQGRIVEARVLLAEARKRHPALELPEDLQALGRE